jgi:hypothetical protein
MRRDPAIVRPVPAARSAGRVLAATMVAAAMLLAALAGWQSGPGPASGLRAATAARLVAVQLPRAPQPDDSWQASARPDAVLAWSRDRLVPTSHLPNDRSGMIRADWVLLLLLVAVGTAGAGAARRRDTLVGISPSRGPPAR